MVVAGVCDACLVDLSVACHGGGADVADFLLRRRDQAIMGLADLPAARMRGLVEYVVQIRMPCRAGHNAAKAIFLYVPLRAGCRPCIVAKPFRNGKGFSFGEIGKRGAPVIAERHELMTVWKFSFQDCSDGKVSVGVSCKHFGHGVFVACMEDEPID